MEETGQTGQAGQTGQNGRARMIRLAARRQLEVAVLRRLMLQRMTRGLGLRPDQLGVMECIVRNPGCTQAQVAREMMVTPATMAQTVKRLERAGLIRREVDPANQRCNLLIATGRGQGLARQCREFHDCYDQQVFLGFSDEEIEQFCSTLGRMICNVTGEAYPPRDEGFLPPGVLTAQLMEKIKGREGQGEG